MTQENTNPNIEVKASDGNSVFTPSNGWKDSDNLQNGNKVDITIFLKKKTLQKPDGPVHSYDVVFVHLFNGLFFMIVLSSDSLLIRPLAVFLLRLLFSLFACSRFSVYRDNERNHY